MDVVSVSPLRVGSLIWQPRPSAYVLTVVCKATFLLRPGEATLALEQDPPNTDDRHRDENPARSVHAPSDLAPVKPKPEVLLVGHAFAPEKMPARSLVARLVVGELDKSIEVFCDRLLTKDGALQEGARFVRMPLTYERAAGGPGTWNPVGIRNDARDTYGRRPLPNLQAAGKHVADPLDFIEPAGFGPIAPSWPSRREKLGRHATTWTPSALRERPMPEGIDLGYFNQAPRDQQLAALKENERIVLENLHPDHARLTTSLPGVRPAAFAERARGGQPQRLAMRADTLWLDTDRGIATLTWRGQLPLERAEEAGRVLVGMEGTRRESTWAEIEKLAAGRGKSTEVYVARPEAAAAAPPEEEENPLEATMTVGLAAVAPKGPALPFAQGAGAPPPPPPRASQPSSPGLPFQNPGSPSSQSSGSWPAAVPPPPPPRRPFESSVSPEDDDGETLPPPPFASAAMPMPRPAPLPPVAAPIPPPVVAPPPMVASARSAGDSPWTSGGAAPARETIGMAAATAAVAAVATPSAAEGAQSAGALGASNAAAGAASAPWRAPRRELKSVPEETSAQTAGVTDALQLLWFHPGSVAKIRSAAKWKRVLEEMKRTPLDRDLDEADAGKEPWEVEDRQEVFEILGRGERADVRGVEGALRESVREDGKRVPTLVLLDGDLEMPFDELEALKAAMTSAVPLITPVDEGLRASVGIAKEFLQTPGLSAAPAVSEGLTTKIREAFTREKKALPADWLDMQVERALLTGRHYQKREVFGGTCLRVLVWLPGEKAALIGYLPEELTKKLPMYRRFRARVIAEVHPAQDQYEARREGLRVVAVGRVS